MEPAAAAVAVPAPSSRPALVDWPWLRSAAWVTAAFLAVVVLSRVALPKTVPFGVLLHGIVIGSINALLAVGIVLIYRSHRIINFAHAEIGVFGGILFENLAREWKVPWLAALAVGTLAAAALGGLLEALVLRRFARSPRLITTVATIGIGQLVVVLTWLTASGFGSIAASAGITTPLSGIRVTVGDVVFSGDALLLVAVVPVVVVAIELLLRRTSFGIAVRASAESNERAALLGVPVKVVGTATWVVASGLAGLAAILHAPVIGLLSGGTAQGPTFLLRALTAAVVGRMENLRVAVVAALFLGLVDQALYIAYDGSTVADVVFVVIAIGALLVQRQTSGRARDAGTAWVATEEIRPVPTALRRLPEIRIGRVLTVGAAFLSVAILAMVLSPGDANRAATIAIYCVVAVSLVVL
ncbi:MAG: branched-chain amino acid ABC transporter permease, partial [Acidimicrobiales bacterium]